MQRCKLPQIFLCALDFFVDALYKSTFTYLLTYRAWNGAVAAKADFNDFAHAMLCINAAYDVSRFAFVCLSVRPSVTFVYSVETYKHIFIFFTVR